MLKINKSINLVGESSIEGIQVVYMSASISTDGSTNTTINTNINNKELYETNKSKVREEMVAFQNMVYETEDSLFKS